MNKSSFASPQATKLLANRYQLRELIGNGGMGNVFLANDILLGGTPVAIKFLAHTVCEPKMQQDFAREALMSAALSQKSIHIVRAYDYGVSETGNPYYVMEYLPGKCLKEFMPMDLPMFMTLMRQICLGLQCAHQGINIDGKIYPLVHRDIKPNNILVIPDPILGQLVKILDFGIAKFLNHTATNSTNRKFHGTLPYCSPEQLEGEELDSRSDIYSLGVVMFEMLTGEKPWQPETDHFGAWYKAHHFEQPRAIAQIKPDLQLPRALNNLIMACLAKKASNRPQNMAEVLRVLENINRAHYFALPLNISCQQVETNLPPELPKNSELPPAIEQACYKLTWPEKKPIQEIVFPQVIDTEQGSVASLWLMLSTQEIKKRSLSIRHNEFLFIASPHPMLLWLTVLYNRLLVPKWLPCYLDMQNPQNQRLVTALAESERYPLILFTLEPPHSCISVISSYIDPSKRQLLKTWVKQSQSLPHADQAQLSKNILKQQYKQMQSQIQQRLGAKPPVVASRAL
ncbi:serine/threonine protein kinase [Calothrix sp. FACHB-1219]|uniref:protein kinase domain-containing protein n=1 Tax=unclassified Calothrix TaxID=2619626 RepID=UPI001686D493|nr:protein kinase [Calothrix sp. FACHB-168]MBD2202556.1 serine/threonine protein kinase [Calothrix sp. FACHB-168]MBD2217854.1 serine/threonine protein kinase [Calothrix sp. FACHB-1219]